jgi:hypothetical protein
MMIQYSFRLKNSRKDTVELRLEPWGESCELGAGASVEVRASGPAGDSLEIDSGDDAITVYGWAGSTVSIFLDGKPLLK